jgi:hypothetical protein
VSAKKSVLTVLALTLATYPVFFVLYRLMIFQTTPRDDYAYYLLWLAHAPGGALPGSPYIYRIFSIVLAWPLYHLLPVFHLTNIPASTPIPYQRATAALALLSDIGALAASVLTFGVAQRLGKTALTALLSALLVYGGGWFTQMEGIDTVTILGVVGVVILLQKPDRYFPALLALTFVNEKIAIITFLFLALRCATSADDRKQFGVKLGIAALALAVYGAVLATLHVGGNAYQLTPSGYPANFVHNLAVNLSLRGVLLSWGPTALFLALALIGLHGQPSLFSRRDALLAPALVAVGMVLTQDFNIGRVVMMAIPLVAIPAAERLARALEA